MRDMGAERGIGLPGIMIKGETVSLNVPSKIWHCGGWSLCPKKSIKVREVDG